MEDEFLVNFFVDTIAFVKGKFSHFFSQFRRKFLHKVRSSRLEFSIKHFIWKLSYIYQYVVEPIFESWFLYKIYADWLK